MKTIKKFIREAFKNSDVRDIIERLINDEDAYIYVISVHGKMEASLGWSGKTKLVNGDQDRIVNNTVKYSIYDTNDCDDQLLKDTIKNDMDMSWDDVSDQFTTIMELANKDKTTTYFIGNF